MDVFELIIALLLAGAGLTVLSHRLGAPYPALVALAGAVLALVPGTPTLVLDPELALALFVAPVLVDAAFDASPRDLRANWRIVTGLAIGAVVLTILVVAGVVRLLVPGMPWSVAIALGAIIAPPDAAAATAVLKQLHPPHRLLVILEGESLFNDASALLIYRLAVGVTLGGSLSGTSVAPVLLVVTVGSVVLGWVLSRVLLQLTARVQDDVAVAVVLQFCGTFGVWILAERLHLSGILTVVTLAMSLARPAGALTPARIRIPSFAVWEFAVFVLNVLAFILVGFQLKAILARLDSRMLLEYVGIAAAVCAATILARIVWVGGASAFGRWWYRRGPEGSRAPGHSAALTRPAATIVGWCGMRGIVTLAAALALPAGGPDSAPFPYRDLILFTAFSVVLGTLVVQGMTLRPLMKALHLEDDGAVEREVRLARVETLRAALGAMTGLPQEHLSGPLRRRYETLLRRAEAALVSPGDAPTEASTEETLASRADEISARTVASAERQRLAALREDGTIGDSAFQRLEQELDLAELGFRHSS